MRVFAASFWQEAVRIARTPVDFLLLTLFPLVMLGAMAAMMWGGTLTNLPVVIVDQDGGALARTITRNIDATPYLEVVAQTPQRAEALAMVRREQAVAFMVIPKGISARSSNSPPVTVFYEAVFLSTGSVASTYLRLVTTATLLRQTPRNLGVAGASVADRTLPTIQITLLGNPTLSLEWFLGMLIGPSILHLVIAISCIGSLGLLMRDKSFGAYVSDTQAPLAALSGRLAVHVLVGILWAIAWLLWMTLARGYRAEGSVFLIVVGFVLLFVATAAIGLLFIAVTREVGTSFSGAVIVAGSALAYSGATLPLSGGLWFAQDWSKVLPLTHFIILQMDQLIGVTARADLTPMIALLLYPLIGGVTGMVLILRSKRPA